ncbi:helix-turn-helix transcriptional regulator [Lactobacillus sp. ESL0230]|uniref:helix-turn-helix domain-containing protein n=1 Tax=Lactobacillus sp. ESL0230 TaxID=2069353 RepID=UPI000EFB385E|nr:helix-turn-helix transcriptional regulator [Lactobacillus sp. ESL0230]RMC46541.1 XRE family transcriptional regulator [Lactobacillus sp. ESL0230]
MNRLKELREQKGLSQSKLCLDLNCFLRDKEKKTITFPTWSRWENGINTPTEAMWENLADYFKVPISYIKGEIDINKIQKILQTMLLINCTDSALDSFNQGEFADYDRETKKCLALNCLILLIHQELNINPYDQFKAVVNKTIELMSLTNKEKNSFINKNMKHANGSNKKRDINIANELLNFYDNL